MTSFICSCFYSDIVWIVGDSIIRRVECGFPLPLKVHWKGKGGAGVADLYDLREQLLRLSPPPVFLLVHLGTNDLVRIDEFALRQRVAVMLRDCLDWCPHLTLIWSDILPRVFYFGAHSQPALERKRRIINRWARSQCSKLPRTLCLHHPQFQWADFSLYHFDGVHFSPAGNRIFRSNIEQFLRSHIAC